MAKKPDEGGQKSGRGRVYLAVFIIVILAMLIGPWAYDSFRRAYCPAAKWTFDGWTRGSLTVKAVGWPAGFDTHPNIYGGVSIYQLTAAGPVLVYAADWSWTNDWFGGYNYNWQALPAEIYQPNPYAPGSRLLITVTSGTYNETVRVAVPPFDGPVGTLLDRAPFPLADTSRSTTLTATLPNFSVAIGLTGSVSCGD